MVDIGWAAEMIDELGADSSSTDGDESDQPPTTTTTTTPARLTGLGLMAQGNHHTGWDQDRRILKENVPAPLTLAHSSRRGSANEERSSPRHLSPANTNPSRFFPRSGSGSPSGGGRKARVPSLTSTDTDLTPRVRQAAQMDHTLVPPSSMTIPMSMPSSTAVSAREGGQPETSSGSEDLPRLEALRLEDLEKPVDGERSGDESSSSFGDDVPFGSRQRTETEYWDPMSPSAMMTIEPSREDEGEGEGARRPSGGGLLAARERAARARSIYLSSIKVPSPVPLPLPSESERPVLASPNGSKRPVGMKRTVSRAAELSESVGALVDETGAEEIVWEDEGGKAVVERPKRSEMRFVFLFSYFIWVFRWKVHSSLFYWCRPSRTPSPSKKSSAQPRPYAHSKQPSTSTIRPSSPSFTLPSLPTLYSRESADATPASPSNVPNPRHSLTHAQTLEELTAAVDSIINDTDGPAPFDLQMNFQEIPIEDEGEGEGEMPNGAISRSYSTDSEASTWGDHAPPRSVSSLADREDSFGFPRAAEEGEEAEYVLVESPSFPPPGQTTAMGFSDGGVQRAPSFKRMITGGLRIGSPVLISAPLSPGKPVESASSAPDHARSHTPIPSPNPTPTSATYPSGRPPLQPTSSNGTTTRTSQTSVSRPTASPGKPYVFAPVGQWPKAMVFGDIKGTKSSGERAVLYAKKINELCRTETGLNDWVRIAGGHGGSFKFLFLFLPFRVGVMIC